MRNRIFLEDILVLLITVFLVFSSSASFAEEDNAVNMPAWAKASIVLGTTVCLYFADEDIQQWTQDNRGATTDKIAEFYKPFGDYKVVVPSLAIALAYGHVGKRERIEDTALRGLESLLVTGVITQSLKYAGHRHRPSSGDPYNTWDGPSFLGGNDSFPSGHASTAFSVLTVIAMKYNDYPVVPPLAYGIATLTALSRVNDNKHWASDIFFGSALGYLTAKAVVDYHRKDGELSMYPVINQDGIVAIVMSYAL